MDTTVVFVCLFLCVCSIYSLKFSALGNFFGGVWCAGELIDSIIEIL